MWNLPSASKTIWQWWELIRRKIISYQLFFGISCCERTFLNWDESYTNYDSCCINAVQIFIALNVTIFLKLRFEFKTTLTPPRIHRSSTQQTWNLPDSVQQHVGGWRMLWPDCRKYLPPARLHFSCCSATVLPGEKRLWMLCAGTGAANGVRLRGWTERRELRESEARYEILNCPLIGMEMAHDCQES